MDRSTRHPRAAMATTLPLVLRHHAIDVETPPRDDRTRPLRPAWPRRPHQPGPVPSGTPAAVTTHRHRPHLRAAVPQPRRDPHRLARRPRRPTGRRGVRVPPRPRTTTPTMGAAAPANRLPAAHVRCPHPIDDHGHRRDAAALAQTTPHRRPLRSRRRRPVHPTPAARGTAQGTAGQPTPALNPSPTPLVIQAAQFDPRPVSITDGSATTES